LAGSGPAVISFRKRGELHCGAAEDRNNHQECDTHRERGGHVGSRLSRTSRNSS
jgi:hypothetical protein